MAKEVNGFLAKDGSFFENEPECERHEYLREIETLCVSHGVNFENFMSILNAWHRPIEGYYNADNKCKTPQVGSGIKFEGADEHDDYDIQSDDIPAFLPPEEDRADAPVRDKDAPGFLEQQIGRYK